jgi:hypothetical protein
LQILIHIKLIKSKKGSQHGVIRKTPIFRRKLAKMVIKTWVIRKTPIFRRKLAKMVIKTLAPVLSHNRIIFYSQTGLKIGMLKGCSCFHLQISSLLPGVVVCIALKQTTAAESSKQILLNSKVEAIFTSLLALNFKSLSYLITYELFVAKFLYTGVP